MRGVVVAIVLVGGLACGSESDPTDCLANGDDTICFDGVPDEGTVDCRQIGANTFLCGATQVRTNFGSVGDEAVVNNHFVVDEPVRSAEAVVWKPRRVQKPARVDRRFCDPTGHVCVECATCDGAVVACVECANEGRAFRTEPVEPHRDE